MIRISLIEHEQTTRDALKILIDSIESYTLSGVYENENSFIKDKNKDTPDVLLFNIFCDESDSKINVLKTIKRKIPKIDIIAYSSEFDENMILQALSAGVNGFIIHDSNYNNLLRSIKEVRKGGAPLSREVARFIIESFHVNVQSPLSHRETEVLTLLARGKTYTMIATELFIHKETVKTHIKNIYSKLHTHNKAETIEKALKEGFIESNLVFKR